MACTPACWAMPDCAVCGRCKAPRGRSVPAEAGGSLCVSGCPGYNLDPQPGHYWPGEAADDETSVAPEAK